MNLRLSRGRSSAFRYVLGLGLHEEESRSAAQSFGGRGDGIHQESEHGDDEDVLMRDAADNGEDDASIIDEGENENMSDDESFTLKDRQQTINETHPFGIRIWKPALYKKNRSV